MRKRSAIPILTLAAVTMAALPAAADFGVLWEQEGFTVQPAAPTAVAIGDMIGNGQLVVVGNQSGNTQIRDVLTGALLHEFPIYEVQADTYTMIDLDGDGSMECLAAGGGATALLDWFILTGAGTPDLETRDRIALAVHPNPSRPGATLSWTLREPAEVEVSVYSVAGRRVRTLVRELQPSGPREVRWDGRDDAGLRLASGTYLVELRIDGERTASRKSVLLR